MIRLSAILAVTYVEIILIGPDLLNRIILVFAAMNYRMHAFGAIAAAAFVAAILMTPYIARAATSNYDWLVVKSATIKSTANPVTTVTATMSDDIPRKVTLTDAVAGIAWADLGTGNVLLATYHYPNFRDSAQNPDSWHLHTATLNLGATDGSGNVQNACVAEFTGNPVGGISIKDSTMSVTVRNSALAFEPSTLDGAVGFVVNGVAASTECPAVFGEFGLAVTLSDDPVAFS